MMPATLAELRANPQLGMLRAYPALLFGGPAAVQYWSSYEQLTEYAGSSTSEHLPAWRTFNLATRASDAVGIWHETYRISAGQWETIYGGMPPVGFRGAVGGVDLSARSTSSTRIGDEVVDTAPVDPPDAD